MEEVPVIIRGIGSFTYLCNGSDVFIQFFMLSCVKYSSKRSVFSDFMFIFAMSLMILLLLNCSTKASEKSDIAKSWTTFCCSGTCERKLN